VLPKPQRPPRRCCTRGADDEAIAVGDEHRARRIGVSMSALHAAEILDAHLTVEGSVLED
jgi:hypothetical protein